MNKKTIFIGLGVLAAAGLGIFLYNRNKKDSKTTTTSPKSSADGDDEESNLVTTPDEAFQAGVSSHWAKLAKARYGADGDDEESSNYITPIQESFRKSVPLAAADGDDEESSNYVARHDIKDIRIPKAAVSYANGMPDLLNADGLDEEFSNIRFKVKVGTPYVGNPNWQRGHVGG